MLPIPSDAIEVDVGVFECSRGDGQGEVTFRWRMDERGLKHFYAYGWHNRRIGYGRSKGEPEFGRSILDGPERNAAAQKHLALPAP